MDPVPDPPTSPPPLEVSSSVKKPVWNIPSNGSIEVKPPVIDESSWPALSESAKSPLKSSDGSTAVRSLFYLFFFYLYFYKLTREVVIACIGLLSSVDRSFLFIF